MPAMFTAKGMLSTLPPHLIIIATAGSSVTVTNGSITIIPTQTSGTTDTWGCDLPSLGIWLVSDGITSRSISVTKIQAYRINFTIPDGKTVTPTDNIQTWLSCADVTGVSYTTINQVLADSTLMDTLFSSENASDYLARSTTWASSVVANATAMTKIGNNDYCSEVLLANSTWLTAICGSSNYAKILIITNPNMTSKTAPAGNRIGASSETAYGVLYAFNGASFNLTAANTFWSTSPAKNAYCWYSKDNTDFSVFKVRFKTSQDQNASGVSVTIAIIGSNDGTNWTTIKSFTKTDPYYSSSTLNFNENIPYNETSNYRYWGIKYTANTLPYAVASEVHFYGRIKKNLVA